LLALLPGVMMKASSACLRPLDSTAVPTMVNSQVVSRRGPVSCKQGVREEAVACKCCADVAKVRCAYCSCAHASWAKCTYGNRIVHIWQYGCISR
jgi:hypothetical protein